MTGRDRRALSWGAAAVGAAVIGLRLLPVIASAARGLREDVTQARLMRDRMAAAVRAVPVIADSAADLRRAFVAVAPALLPGDSRAEALASLSAQLNLVADRSRAELQRADDAADSLRVERLRRLTVRATIETDTRGLAAFLRALATGSPLLSVGAVRLVGQDPASGEGVAEVLNVELSVSGWYLKGRDKQ